MTDHDDEKPEPVDIERLNDLCRAVPMHRLARVCFLMHPDDKYWVNCIYNDWHSIYSEMTRLRLENTKLAGDLGRSRDAFALLMASGLRKKEAGDD